MALGIQFSKRGLRDLTDLPRDAAAAIMLGVNRYAETGHGDVKHLHDVDPALRLRVGDHRVLFDMEGQVMVIKAVRHRREAYR